MRDYTFTTHARTLAAPMPSVVIFWGKLTEMRKGEGKKEHKPLEKQCRKAGLW